MLHHYIPPVPDTVSLEDRPLSDEELDRVSGGDTLPQDSFSINFAKIEYGYKPRRSAS